MFDINFHNYSSSIASEKIMHSQQNDKKVLAIMLLCGSRQVGMHEAGRQAGREAESKKAECNQLAYHANSVKVQPKTSTSS